MAEDYAKLGFMCGLEIHQQLDTGKLFCSCPSIVHDPNKPDITVTRKLRPVVGETGEIDKAALHEMEKGKFFKYEACTTSSCLVELDEEPPHPINNEALKAALQIAQLLHAKVVDEIQVMRKTVIDGSNVSGFQRTALVARNGWIETSKGKVRIPLICLEEEAAQRVKEDDKSVTFRLDRLGVPLIEIGTEPDIKDPEHVKETAQKLGMILRSTGKAKRGIGTIRQDVNVNIKGHPRVEIKGFQDLKTIVKVAEKEIERQQKEIKSGKKLEPHVRKHNPDGTTSFLRPMPGSARMYPETDIAPVKPSKAKIEKVELIEDRAKKIEKLGIGKDLASHAVKQDKDKFIIEAVKKYKKLKPAFIAETVCTAEQQVKSQYNVEISPSEEDFELLLKELENEKVAKESVLEVLKENKPVKEVIGKYELMSDAELEKELKKIAAENKGAPFNVVIGKAMGKLRGKASGKKVAEILKKVVK